MRKATGHYYDNAKAAVRIHRALKQRGQYELHVGRVLKVEHWDRKKRKPKR